MHHIRVSHRTSNLNRIDDHQEKKEAAAWQDDDTKGGKAKKQAAEDKRKADLARKAEAAKLLAEEEASLPAKAKAAPKAGKKKDFKPAGPGAIAAGGGLASTEPEPKGKGREEPEEVESYAATGLDNALDLLEVVTAKMDKASVGQQAAGIEKHPEVCGVYLAGATRSYKQSSLYSAVSR